MHSSLDRFSPENHLSRRVIILILRTMLPNLYNTGRKTILLTDQFRFIYVSVKNYSRVSGYFVSQPPQELDQVRELLCEKHRAWGTKNIEHTTGITYYHMLKCHMDKT